MTFDFSLLHLAAFGFFTGLGTTFGTELAKLLFERLKKKATKTQTQAKGDMK